MAFWDPFLDNLEIFAIIFRVILVVFGLFELYRFTKKRGDLTEKHSWRPKPLQEAMTNLFMIGLFIFVFILVIYFDYMSWSSYNTRGEYGWVYIPIDVVLGVFIISLYLLPKRFLIAEEGFFYSGELTKWEDVIDYDVLDRRGILSIKHWRKMLNFSFKTETQVPLPENRKEMEEALDTALGRKKEKKKKGKGKKGIKKDTEDEGSVEKERPQKKSLGKKGKDKDQKRGRKKSKN